MRKRIYTMIELADECDRLSRIYDLFMIAVIALSLIPLMTKNHQQPLFVALDRFSVTVFILDYLLRWGTADYKFGSRSVWSFLRYPFSPMAIIDLLSILPSLTILNSGFRLFRIFRMFRAFRVFRVLRAVRYSHTLRVIVQVLRDTRRGLITVGTLAVGYILVMALLVFNVEPDTFPTFFDALYWATVSLTTVGYGDITPVTLFGRLATILSSLFGVAIVALPSGIITAGFMTALARERREKEDTKNPPEFPDTPPHPNRPADYNE